ncbi:hypothetical protein HRI_004750000 [Hibiscus trionum]|uniref:Reverse transcriptase domain-containing protein n=1 Tax=Hibiscus trionum TaxID=183268 RepID=A0A9W7MMR5_HIBTR|nr:hypothetical protein HRI_004750000 [Hibiscus trionum]
MLRTNLVLLEEIRETTEIRLMAQNNQVARYYNSKVRNRQNHVGDLVLRNIDASVSVGRRVNMSPNREGPYKVITKITFGAYKLQDMKGIKIPDTWNVRHLKKFYI